jgi:hypothetical protein
MLPPLFFLPPCYHSEISISAIHWRHCWWHIITLPVGIIFPLLIVHIISAPPWHYFSIANASWLHTAVAAFFAFIPLCYWSLWIRFSWLHSSRHIFSLTPPLKFHIEDILPEYYFEDRALVTLSIITLGSHQHAKYGFRSLFSSPPVRYHCRGWDTPRLRINIFWVRVIFIITPLPSRIADHIFAARDAVSGTPFHCLHIIAQYFSSPLPHEYIYLAITAYMLRYRIWICQYAYGYYCFRLLVADRVWLHWYYVERQYSPPFTTQYAIRLSRHWLGWFWRQGHCITSLPPPPRHIQNNTP